MIKSLTSALVISFSMLSSVQAQELPRKPLEVSQAFERHFNAADLDRLAKLYAKNGVFVPAPGVQLRDPAQIRGALTQFLAPKLPIKMTVRQVYEAGDTALVVFDWTIKGTGADGKPVDLSGTGADVVARQADGTWLYVIDNPFGVAQPAK